MPADQHPDDLTEPMLMENASRFVIFPIKHHDLWLMFKKVRTKLGLGLGLVLALTPALTLSRRRLLFGRPRRRAASLSWVGLARVSTPAHRSTSVWLADRPGARHERLGRAQARRAVFHQARASVFRSKRRHVPNPNNYYKPSPSPSPQPSNQASSTRTSSSASAPRCSTPRCEPLIQTPSIQHSCATFC